MDAYYEYFTSIVSDLRRSCKSYGWSGENVQKYEFYAFLESKEQIK